MKVNLDSWAYGTHRRFLYKSQLYLLVIVNTDEIIIIDKSKIDYLKLML